MAREQSVQSLTRAYRAGCRIGSGSDLLGDMVAQRAVELELKGQVMTPMDVLLSATRVNAELFRMEDRIGTLEPDKYADLIVVAGDPAPQPADLPARGQSQGHHEGRAPVQAGAVGRCRGPRPSAGSRWPA